MKHVMPPRVWDTGRAREQVAQHLGLPYRDEMQDWPWQVALPEKIDDYFQLYTRSTDDEERVVLMEMLLEATSEQRKVAVLDRQ